MGVIYFFRAISMASTQLPLASRNYQCSPQVNLVLIVLDTNFIIVFIQIASSKIHLKLQTSRLLSLLK